MRALRPYAKLRGSAWSRPAVLTSGAWKAPAIIANMIDAFRELKDGEATLLVVEQNFAFARQLGDAVAVMDDGKVAHRGDMASFAADAALQQHLLGLGMDTHQ